MKTKKHPNANLEQHTKLFLLLGLVVALGICYGLIQQKTYVKDPVVFNDSNHNIEEDLRSQIEYTIYKEKIKPKPVSTDLTKIEVKPDAFDIPETVILPIDPDSPTKQVEFIDPGEPDEGIAIDYLIDLVETVPTFPGCEGTNEERKTCLSRQLRRFIVKHFNSGLGYELGLSSGVQQIFTQFKINAKGELSHIRVKSPYPALEREALRVLNLLPTMEPGKMGTRSVSVKYAMPIRFMIE